MRQPFILTIRTSTGDGKSQLSSIEQVLTSSLRVPCRRVAEVEELSIGNSAAPAAALILGDSGAMVGDFAKEVLRLFSAPQR